MTTDGERCLLLVEDNAGVRDTLANLFAREGVVVIAAANFESGLAVLGNSSQCLSFDAIIFDLGLPDGNGEDLLEMARERQPGARIVIYSGDPSSETRSRLLAKDVAGYLEKPAPFAELWLASFPDMG